MDPAKSLATSREVAAYLRKSEGTLANWRYHGIGPAYIPMTAGKGKGVLYRWSDVEAWLKAQTVTTRTA